MNHALKRLFHTSMVWNAIESVLYQLIMCIHQGALFFAIERSVYGFAGVLFSSIYALVTIVNLGLDGALTVWWHTAITSKRNFQRLIINQLAAQIILTFPATLLLTYMQGFAWHLLPIIGSITMLESIKKTFKTCLYLRFDNKKVAPTEIALLALYVALVWIQIWYYGSIQATQLIIPLILSSALATSIYGYQLLRWYHTLADSDTDDCRYAPSTIFFIRTNNYLTQITHLLFSGNILIPLFATRFGLEAAGTLKLVNTIAYGVGTLMHKIVGITSQALFAYTKTADLQETNQVFASCTNKIYQLMYLAGIFTLINSSKMGHQLSAIGTTSALLFAALVITENICNIYEHFLTVKGYGYYNVLIQTISFVSAYGFISYLSVPLYAILILLLCIRVLSLIAFEGIVRRYWSVKSDMRLKPLYGIGIVIASLIVLWAL